MPPSVQVTLASGTRWSASASALMTRSLTETFHAGLPSLSFGAAALMSVRSASSASISVSIGQVEMRDRLLRLDQPPGDDLADVVVRDDLVAARLEELHHLARRSCSARRRRGGAGAGAAAGAALASAPPPALAASMSDLTTRPCGPEPFTAATSMPLSLARRRASGEAKTRPPPLVAATGGGRLPAGAAAGLALEAAAGAGAAFASVPGSRRSGRLGLGRGRRRGRRGGRVLDRALVLALVEQHGDRRVDGDVLGALGHQDLAHASPRRPPRLPSSPCRSRSRR